MDTILFVSAEETLAVRHKILRPGLPLETAIFDYDKNPGTFHLAYFKKDKNIGVISFGLNSENKSNDVYQLRGMAVLEEFQSQGIGKELLNSGIKILQTINARVLWCNARKHVVGFYQKNAFQIIGEEFDIPTVGPHLKLCREI